MSANRLFSIVTGASTGIGFDAMINGEGDVVSGLKNKVQSAAANVTRRLGFWRASIARWPNPAPPRHDRCISRQGRPLNPGHARKTRSVLPSIGVPLSVSGR
jgi:hypothetical protein